MVILLTVSVAILSSCGELNMKNGVGTDASKIPMCFIYTGISVKNYEARVYDIVSDKNGWLYYSADVSGELCVVLDEDGNPTKDINVVTGDIA